MSYSSDIKQQLQEVVNKKECCKNSFKSGLALEHFNRKCEKDIGCYLRGVFIRCGNITEPKRNFMLSFSPPADFVDYLESFLDECGMTAKRTLRKNKPLLYYKASESIEDVISLIGCTKVTLDIMNAKIMNDVRNNTNRICNAETANMDRIAKAAAEQREAILVIEKHGAMHNLNAELRECAELRLEHPDVSLSELAKLFKEPVSKSGLNHRFKKLIEIAETLENT